ncbi:c-type cytochrome biogenesis protein CcmI [Achromobacter xylosoxidans]|uniref:C-type cytochrome biogenesis protein CcmI n=1 Tax=Alcaligenes xylosoxydans xylosoxydans TaxID=85698 RepID=A0A2L0PTH1_ALCXX|nr:c-type cytochrome biogenesis protein CcmI [Achromobacter xylosoxidans]AUZ18021.1 c-type cytochrome biogenesis protein CcmI [Achromobacter xylosoxidans]
MTPLWLAVLVLLLATLLCLLPPLLRRPPPAEDNATDAGLRAFYLAQREQLRRDQRDGALSADAAMRADEELQRDLLQDLAQRHPGRAVAAGQRVSIAAACLLSLALPLAAALLYNHLGNPRAAASVATASAAEPHAGDDGDTMALAINALAQRLRAAPDDADGWYTLARSYETLGRYDDAAAAYREVLRLAPAQPQVLADLADALLSANQGAPDAASIAAVAQALAANPDQPKALALAGMMALRRGDAAQALEYWQRLQGLLPPDSEAARQIETNIAQARAVASAGGAQPAMPGQMPGQTQAAAATQSAPPQTSATAPPASQATAPGRVSGQARIAPALMAQVQPTDTVFILARPASGSRMPLAVLRLRAADLPRAFTLDDSNAMSPQALLSSAGRVRVEIRVSRSGTAMPQAGDLGGTPVEVDVPAGGLELVADTVLR